MRFDETWHQNLVSEAFVDNMFAPTDEFFEVTDTENPAVANCNSGSLRVRRIHCDHAAGGIDRCQGHFGTLPHFGALRNRDTEATGRERPSLECRK